MCEVGLTAELEEDDDDDDDDDEVDETVQSE